MSQRNIAELPRPVADCRVDRVSHRPDGTVGFETRLHAQGEDARRVRGLCNSILHHTNAIDVEHARRLAVELYLSAETGENPDSPASSLYMRKQRIKVIGALWALMEGR